MSAGQQVRHTPGPWIVVDGHWLKPAGKTRIVATILDFDDCMVYRDGYNNEEMDAEVEANKRLIVSAPDLLEALKSAEPALWILAANGNKDAAERHAKARAAIARATGAV